MCFLLLRALSATTQLPVMGGAPLMPHAWRLLPTCPPREPYTAGLRAACPHLSGPWAGKKPPAQAFWYSWSPRGCGQLLWEGQGPGKPVRQTILGASVISEAFRDRTTQPLWVREGSWPDGVSTLPCCSHIPKDALPAS